MAFYGAKVLHPETIGPAVEARIPVRVLSSKEPNRKGTTIVLSTTEAEPITGIAIKRAVSLIQLYSGDLLPDPTTLPLAFDALSEHKIIPLATSLSFDKAMLVLDNPNDVRYIQTALAGLSKIDTGHGRALLTLVGHGLQETSGIAARLFSSIKKVNCEMIAYGGVGNAISLVIKDSEVESTVRKIHKEFFS
jgi:aspartate kinase